MVKVKVNVEVDDYIADLVKALNEVGLETTYSCGGHFDDVEAYVVISMENIKQVIVKDGKLCIYWDIPEREMTEKEIRAKKLLDKYKQEMDIIMKEG